MSDVAAMSPAARATLDAAAARYRRTYDRLYVASQKAGSAEECERIEAALAAANETYAAAKRAAGQVQA